MSRRAKRVLVVAAHPDDELLGLGGTLARHRAEGDRVSVVLLADGITSRAADADVERRVGAAERVAEVLGIEYLAVHRLPDNRMDELARLEVIRLVEAAVAAAEPEIVYGHHGGDLNVDHRRAHEAVLTACRPQPGSCVRQLRFFETPSSTEWQVPGSGAPFEPSLFVDIGAYLDLKLEALGAYADEMRPWPHARSFEAVTHLARLRGASVGLEAAEAFVLGRMIE